MQINGKMTCGRHCLDSNKKKFKSGTNLLKNSYSLCFCIFYQFNSRYYTLVSETYQRGQQLTNLMCVRNTPSVVLSRREALAHEKNSTKIPELHNLKKNMLLRCSFESSCDSGIYVFASIKNYYKNIFVLRKVSLKVVVKTLCSRNFLERTK
jgi:hypothetical protein